jgi:hypothetical protein
VAEVRNREPSRRRLNPCGCAGLDVARAATADQPCRHSDPCRSHRGHGHPNGQCLGVPGFPQRKLTADQRRRLAAAQKAIEKDERRWAELVREFGYSAVAREIGLTPEAVRKRVLRIRGPTESG